MPVCGLLSKRVRLSQLTTALGRLS